jgi:hypothetical protein
LTALYRDLNVDADELDEAQQATDEFIGARAHLVEAVGESLEELRTRVADYTRLFGPAAPRTLRLRSER